MYHKVGILEQIFQTSKHPVFIGVLRHLENAFWNGKDTKKGNRVFRAMEPLGDCPDTSGRGEKGRPFGRPFMDRALEGHHIRIEHQVRSAESR